MKSKITPKKYGKQIVEQMFQSVRVKSRKLEKKTSSTIVVVPEENVSDYRITLSREGGGFLRVNGTRDDSK